MSEHDSVRRALDDLVGVPPISLGRKGAVMSRISKVNHRRRVATQAAFSAFVVVAGTLGATQVINAAPASKGGHVVEIEPTEEPVVEPTEEPTGAPAPKPSATAKPKPVAPVPPKKDEPKPQDPTAKPEPTSTKTYEPKPGYEPKPEPKPTATYTKEPVPGGLTVDFFPYDTARAGAEMNWKVKAYDTSGGLKSIVVYFGDGTSASYGPEPCGADVNVKRFFPHTYAKVGTYGAKTVVTTGGCGAATETRTEYASVKVLDASAAGNGAAKPTVTAQQVEAAIAKLALHGADSDGWVKKFWVDWGDGTETYVGPRPFDGCQDGKPSSYDAHATHEYAAPGTYMVKVTVMSTSCDAGEAQTTTISLTVTA